MEQIIKKKYNRKRYFVIEYNMSDEPVFRFSKMLAHTEFSDIVLTEEQTLRLKKWLNEHI